MINDLKNISFMTVIAGKNIREPLVIAISQNGGRFIQIAYGRGAVKASYLMDAFGLVAEENKVIITFLLIEKNLDGMMKMLVDKFDFDKPNTGIAFTVPIDGLSF